MVGDFEFIGPAADPLQFGDPRVEAVAGVAEPFGQTGTDELDVTL